MILRAGGSIKLQDFVIAGQHLPVEGDGAGRDERLGVGQGGKCGRSGSAGHRQLLASLRVQLADTLGSGVAGEELLLE